MAAPDAAVAGADQPRARRADSLARAALEAGARHAEAGELAESRRWLERARRLAPDDWTVLLALAATCLRQGDPECRTLFERVAAGADLREAWLGVLAACQALDDAAGAVGAAAAVLSRHAAATAGLPLAALDRAARDAGLPGWCALDSARGMLIVSLAAPARLRLTLDGRAFAAAAGADGVALPPRWRQGRAIAALAGGRALLGSSIEVATIRRVEGFVETADGDLRGWAWHPHDPDADPVLTLVHGAVGGATLKVTATDTEAAVRHPVPLARPRGFRLDPAALAGWRGAVAVRGEDGRDLAGSPLDPSLERESARRLALRIAAQHPIGARPARPPPVAPALFQPTPAELVGPPPAALAQRRAVDVVVPVHGAAAATLACLDALLNGLPDWARVVVVDDASPDAALAAALDQLAVSGRVQLLRQPRNRGFPAAANRGIRHDPGRDVVLLNSDTLPPPGWLHRLREAAYANAATGSATPLSNDATILSYPNAAGGNPIPDHGQTIALDRLAARANAGRTEVIPTAVGFCVYLRRDCLRATGALREDLFAQGYGEENDFCLRARHLGWRHVAALDVFVGHVGGQSFGAPREHLLARNVGILERLHPGYLDLVEAFARADPLAPARRRLDSARWSGGRRAAGAVLLFGHAEAGGVARRLRERAAALRAEGVRPILLRPGEQPGDCLLSDGDDDGFPNLRFAMPRELDLLARFLRPDRPRRAEVHHLAGHDHAVLALPARLGIPYDLVVHDYALFCPRITLVGAGRRYCGEPAVAGCEACIADLGSRLPEPIGVRALRRRSAVELAGAARVVVPSADVARRLRRHFPATAPVVEPWADPAPSLGAPAPGAPEPGAAGAQRIGGRICVVGAIGADKGYDVLLACARDAAERRLPIEFVVVGYSDDDARLQATGRVFLTGPYAEGEAVALIRAQHAAFAFLPSVWPETWSYTLSEAWAAGLDVVVFDLGTPAERVRAGGRGWVLPLGMPAPALNGRLLGILRALSAGVAAG